ncbi:MAG: mevalonate kinase family protein [Myxococcota bacterium]
MIGMADARPQTTGFGHGKMILVGEHHVLVGATALACGLGDLRTDVILQRLGAADGNLQIQLENHAGLDESALALARRMLQVACEGAGLRGELRALAQSTVPVGRGLGSSAALSVAAVRAAWRLGHGTDPQETQGLVLAREVEGVAHGRSSGLDPAAAWSPGAVLFREGLVQGRPEVQGANLARARWVLLDSGPGAATRRAIEVANAARAAMGPEMAQALADATTRAALDAAHALSADDVAGLADALRRAGDALVPLGVVDDRMKHALAVARDHGALATKQTGAGLGGMLLALVPDETTAVELCRAMQPWTTARFVVPVVA